ncbi:MAG TPA: hypothetical protein VI913_04430 [Candidatus Peribacteraceae bacterium]|nr:hypothetical protein [Candidatus Peribacteraceae bacterium]
MHVLYIDLASHDGLIACSDGQAVLAEEHCNHRIGDHELLPLIEQTLQKARAHVHGRHALPFGAAQDRPARVYDDVTHIACVTGPGGFTSLRVAVTCANVLSDQLNIPSAGVHLSDVHQAKAGAAPFVWIHSTKQEELFARTFGDNTWPEPVHLSLADFMKSVPRNLPWSGELIPEHQTLVKELGLKETVAARIQSWLPQLLTSLPFENKLLLPWYGRGY